MRFSSTLQHRNRHFINSSLICITSVVNEKRKRKKEEKRRKKERKHARHKLELMSIYVPNFLPPPGNLGNGPVTGPLPCHQVHFAFSTNPNSLGTLLSQNGCQRAYWSSWTIIQLPELAVQPPSQCLSLFHDPGPPVIVHPQHDNRPGAKEVISLQAILIWSKSINPMLARQESRHTYVALLSLNSTCNDDVIRC